MVGFIGRHIQDVDHFVYSNEWSDDLVILDPLQNTYLLSEGSNLVMMDSWDNIDAYQIKRNHKI